ncbi:MAG: aspartyl/glutamyl-tRNA amidotransferase subunit C [Anaerolineales bacterium]
MADQITPELFARLVELAALELDEKEGEYLRRELNNQLKAIDELAAIPIPEGTPLASHGVPYTAAIRPAIRNDQAMDSGLAAEIMAQAPETEAGYIAVPEIPHEQLE